MPKDEKQMEPTKAIIVSKSGTAAAMPTMIVTITVRMMIWARLWYWVGILLANIVLHVMSVGT